MAVDGVLKDEASEERGELGRMDKILQSSGRGRSATVTNDGATIFKSLRIDNPTAKALVRILEGMDVMKGNLLHIKDISKVQDDEVNDGTTSVVVLAGELLREADKLIEAKIHPMTIISGTCLVVDGEHVKIFY